MGDSLSYLDNLLLAIILFKALHNPPPTSLNSTFKSTSSVDSHNQRNLKPNLFVARFNTEAGK